ncbi:MAG: hypothetical protein PX481_04560 [Microcystis sp. M53603_WE2]|uniref:hypothetical protein n=1 Tax=unclassified Microcystis TaxID=2643300 RepID=UPI0018AD1645|nr:MULTISPECIES: hypothetical protein [unclassified Microcystis]MCZ8121371.1 hypothetical protein [Microcystis sp. LE18-22.4A]MCZ8364283.1 hypothetical protein [Microcystis sp. LE19-251.1A]MDJ0566162.1 hypothetical protein [Microcystis sp. M49629_WE12]MCZ8027440.1 hypothetical protein [Microcystis sp. LE19-10.1B]MDJ0537972.1 hypothetical protein [Microcystis sp. M53603_WE2]
MATSKLVKPHTPHPTPHTPHPTPRKNFLPQTLSKLLADHPGDLKGFRDRPEG